MPDGLAVAWHTSGRFTPPLLESSNVENAASL
jgi:hypothetical protein